MGKTILFQQKQKAIDRFSKAIIKTIEGGPKQSLPLIIAFIIY